MAATSDDEGRVEADPQELILPDFLVRRREGLIVDLTRLASGADLERVVERIFVSGHLLRGLDYSRLLRLLYDYDTASDGLLEVRLADEVVPFAEERRCLYRSVKVDDEAAWYIFEPVELEKTVEVPIYSVDDNGNKVVAGFGQKVVSEKAQLDFDEFIADMWNKGIRFGIDEIRVREVIESGRTEKLAIAHARPAEESIDAGIEEQTEALHRDNAPKTLADGRIDLGQFANRFPQIAQGTLLLMKTPRQLGHPGRQLDGRLVEARLPEDFDLANLAGDGTRMEVHGGNEFIVATINGFLNLDAKTNKISVTEKIVNLEGVSSRTTGNLALQGKEYEEFGEVQEGRSVEGRNLTFHANVFGKVASAGGRILLEKNLVGGTALNRDGEIVIHGLASNAHVQLGRGIIRARQVENCLLIADRVEVEWARQCTILAEEVEVGAAEGCAVAGKRVHIGTSAASSAEENLVSLLLPDLSGLDRAQADEGRYIAECQDMIDQLKQGLKVMTSQPDLQQYLITAGKLRRKELVLAGEQLVDWQQQTARMGPAMKRINQAREDIQALEAEIGVVRERIAQLEAEKAKAGIGIECTLAAVQGDTRVRTLVVPLDSTPLPRRPAKELRSCLRNPASGEKSLFAGDTGVFNWKNDS